LAVDFYGTAEAVKRRTGVHAEDLAFEDDASLDSFIEELLAEATDLMNRRIRRDTAWNDEDDVPAGLHGIANDIVAGSLREMIVTRQTPLQRIDDFAVRTITARVFSPDIEKRLRLYGAKGVGEIDVTPGDISTGTTALFAHQLDTLETEPGSGF
jgi:hypothetical protein